MVAKTLDDLQVYQQSLAIANAVSAILSRPGLIRDHELHEQISTCSGRIPALISEGFGHRTDRHCAHYQEIARGACNEMCSHLAVACGRGYITADERESLSGTYVVIGKRLTRWI